MVVDCIITFVAKKYVAKLLLVHLVAVIVH